MVHTYAWCIEFHTVSDLNVLVIKVFHIKATVPSHVYLTEWLQLIYRIRLEEFFLNKYEKQIYTLLQFLLNN